MLSVHLRLIQKMIFSSGVVHRMLQSAPSNERKVLSEKGPPKKLPIAGVENVVLVSSAKGGVGKSTVAVNLSLSLKKLTPSSRIGLMDADVFGPSIPKLLGVEGIEPQIDSKKLIIPLQNYGIKTMSFGCLVSKESAIVWRGLMVMSAIQQLLRQVSWGPLDTLVVDTPPGTGDVLLSLCQNSPIQGVVIVTTSHPLSLADTRRGIDMMLKLKIPIIGVVENMSYFICPHCGEKSDPWRGVKSSLNDAPHYGAQKLADEYTIPLLCRLPISHPICDASSDSHPVMISNPQSAIASDYLALGTKVQDFLKTNNTKKS